LKQKNAGGKKKKRGGSSISHKGKRWAAKGSSQNQALRKEDESLGRKKPVVNTLPGFTERRLSGKNEGEDR